MPLKLRPSTCPVAKAHTIMMKPLSAEAVPAAMLCAAACSTDELGRLKGELDDLRRRLQAYG